MRIVLFEEMFTGPGLDIQVTLSRKQELVILLNSLNPH